MKVNLPVHRLKPHTVGNVKRIDSKKIEAYVIEIE